MSMRRAQSVRHYARPSIALASDDLGMLREGNETDEDVLRRQLIEKDRECDKLNTLVQTLQAQLLQRPPLEDVQELQKEYKNLELILQGTQRENERCMGELERVRQREKLLERKLCELAGDNWQSSLDIPPATGPNLGLGGRPGGLIAGGHQRSHTISSSPLGVTTLSGMTYQQNQSSPSRRRGQSYSESDDNSGREMLSASQSRRAAQAQAQAQQQQGQADADREREREERRKELFRNIEEVKLLVLGMDERLASRQQTLEATVERAEKQSERFEVLRRDLAEIAVDG